MRDRPAVSRQPPAASHQPPAVSRQPSADGRQPAALGCGPASPAARAALGRWTALRVRVARLLRRIAGMPDYEAYLAHLRSAHPGCPVPSARRFYEDYLRARYGDGPTRCC